MKKLLQNMIFCIVLCASVFLLASCSRGLRGAEVKAHINEFFAAIVAENYSKAEDLLHPECPADLKNFFNDMEEAKSIDFQEGIKIEEYSGFSSALYDSTVGGSIYELTMKTTVGKKNVEFTIQVVKNEAGFGIYHLDLNT